MLKDTIIDLCLTDKFNIDLLSDNLSKVVNSSIERDISKWDDYVKTPSRFIFSPSSEFYIGNEEIMQKELDYIIDKRLEKSVWEITWSWFDNNEKYSKEFAISENWWKADKAIRTLKLLRSFNRMD